MPETEDEWGELLLQFLIFIAAFVWAQDLWITIAMLPGWLHAL